MKLVSSKDLQAFPEAYACPCEGKCMEPVIADGATVAISKTESINVGDFIALWFRPDVVKKGEHQAIVKLLAARLPEWIKEWPYVPRQRDKIVPMITAYQFNPRRMIVVPCSKIIGIHRVIGLLPQGKKMGHMHKLSDLRPLPSLLDSAEAVRAIV